MDAWIAEKESLRSILTRAPQNMLGNVALVENLAKRIMKLRLPNLLSGMLHLCLQKCYASSIYALMTYLDSFGLMKPICRNRENNNKGYGRDGGFCSDGMSCQLWRREGLRKRGLQNMTVAEKVITTTVAITMVATTTAVATTMERKLEYSICN